MDERDERELRWWRGMFIPRLDHESARLMERLRGRTLYGGRLHLTFEGPPTENDDA